MNKNIDKYDSGKKNIALGLTFIFMGLFFLDILFQGMIYKCLPVRLQNILSESINK